jgi:hypothetical protein
MDIDKDTQEMIFEYMDIGRTHFKTDCRLKFTRSYPLIADFNRKYQDLFFSWMEMIAEVGIEDATCNEEYELFMVREVNLMSAYKRIIPKITITFYSNVECRYIFEGCNKIHEYKFYTHNKMWV